jgi:hypothetical protein
VRARHAKGKRSLAGALALGAICTLVPASASAHFVLQEPASWSVLDQNTGLPEKMGPCGNESNPVKTVNDAGQPVITAFQEGDTITVTIHEVVFHPGHYRISLSTEWATAGDTVQAGFPDEPVVTAGETNSGTMQCPNPASTPCGSVPIEQHTPVAVPGVGWILADDIFEHCDPFTSPQTIKVTLPPGVTCNECAIQVLEFMSDHGLNVPGGCFYHHCANISISAQSVIVDAGGASEASASSGESSGTEGASGSLALSGSAAGAGSTMSSTGSAGSLSASGSAPTGATSGSSSGATASGSGGGTSSPSSTSPSSGGCSVLPHRGLAGGLLAAVFAAAGMMRRRRR